MITFRIVISHRMGREMRERFRHLNYSLAHIREDAMTISAQVQAALDGIRKTQSLMASFKASSALQSQQIATLTDKVTELQAKLDAGGTIGPDDVSALAEITSDIDQVNTDILSAVPANIGGEGGDPNAPAIPPANTETNSGNSSGSQTGSGSSTVTGSDTSVQSQPDPDGNPASGQPDPAIEDPAQHAADAEAASQAKPL